MLIVDVVMLVIPTAQVVIFLFAQHPVMSVVEMKIVIHQEIIVIVVDVSNVKMISIVLTYFNHLVGNVVTTLGYHGVTEVV